MSAHRVDRFCKLAQIVLLRAASWLASVACVWAPLENAFWRAIAETTRPFIVKLTRGVLMLIFLKAWMQISARPALHRRRRKRLYASRARTHSCRAIFGARQTEALARVRNANYSFPLFHRRESVYPQRPFRVLRIADGAKGMGQSRGKYEPLKKHLVRRAGRAEMLTFEDIEEIIGRSLPQSAVKHRAFWANDNLDYHSHARSWMGAGYRVAYVDREQKVVRFERTR